MDNREIFQIIENFTDFIENPKKPVIENLLKILDELIFAYQQCSYIFDSADYQDAPSDDYITTRTFVGNNFPDFSVNLIETRENPSCMLGDDGDAVDDISDIYINI